MKRKTSEAPTRIYSYGVHWHGISHNRDLVDDQYRKADKYRAVLTVLELERRYAVRTILAGAPGTADQGARVAQEEALLDGLLSSVKQANSSARKRVALSSEMRDAIKAARTRLAGARKVWKAAKSTAAADPGVKEQLATAEDRYRERIREERGKCGLYWGTYLVIEAAAEQQRKSKMDPRHRPARGEGRLAVQLQGGLSPAALAEDTRFRLAEVPGSRRRHGQKYLAECSLRVGSDGRAPVFAKFQAVIHRDIPADSTIKWVWLHRERCGRKWVYTLQVVVEAVSFARVLAPARVDSRVAIDLGWRVAEKGNGGLRVAYWRDDAGGEGELRLPPAALSAIDYASQLLGIETNWFEKMRVELVAWIAAHEASGNALPVEHTARLLHLSQWRSAQRLASVVWWWKDHRFAGDDRIFAALNDWRVRRFWHYRDWSLNQRKRGLAQRLDKYRMFAIRLARQYGELVLEDFDLRAFATKPGPTEEAIPAAQRYWRAMGAPHELRQCLVDAFKKLGRTVTKVNPAMSTRRCAGCECETPWDQTQLVHTCQQCGRSWDQDANACANLLRASGSVVLE